MLPKIQYPVFSETLPSNKKAVQFRPMLSKEEKILLMAKEGNDETEILNAVKQVVNNCILNEDIDVDRLPIFDLEYLFIKIRAVSISNVTKVSYKDGEDGVVRDFDINLDEVIVKFPENTKNEIILDNKVSIKMKYPEGILFSNKEFLNAQGQEAFEKLLSSCIDLIIEKEKVYRFDEAEASEKLAFLEALPITALNEMKEFLFNIPHVYYKINYTNDKGAKREIELSSLNDFFTLA